MKVINKHTGAEHNIDDDTYNAWIKAGIVLQVIEVEKPNSIKNKETKKEEDIK